MKFLEKPKFKTLQGTFPGQFLWTLSVAVVFATVALHHFFSANSLASGLSFPSTGISVPTASDLVGPTLPVLRTLR